MTTLRERVMEAFLLALGSTRELSFSPKFDRAQAFTYHNEGVPHLFFRVSDDQANDKHKIRVSLDTATEKDLEQIQAMAAEVEELLAAERERNEGGYKVIGIS